MANPIQFNQIADLEKGIKKAISDLQNLDKSTKKAFRSMASEGEKLEKSLQESTGKVSGLKQQFEKLNPAIEKDRQKIISLNDVLSKEIGIIKNLNGAQQGLANTQRVAADSVEGLKKRLKDLTDQFNKLSISSDPKKIKQLGSQIVKTREQIKSLNDATRRTVNTFNSAKGSYNALVEQNKRLSAILRRLPLEFVKTNQKAQQLAATLKRNTAELKQFDLAIGRSFRNVGNYPRVLAGINRNAGQSIQAFTGLTLGVLGAGLAFQSAVKNNAAYEDSLAGVEKTVNNLSKGEIRELGEQLKTLDTRTSIGGLLGIAKAAGRFQISAGQIGAFTEEVDKLTVALRDELGDDTEQITNEITKIAQVFGTLTKGNEADGITRLGSAINDLGNKTKAQAPFLIDFTKRVQGVAATVDLSLPFVLGLATTLDELGVSAEVSSTVLNKLFAEIGKGDRFEDFAKIIGITVEEYEALIEKSPEEALVRLLKGAESNKEGFAALNEVLTSLGIKGQRSAQVLTALTGNTERLAKNVKLSNEAYKEGTSLQREFEIQNNTLGGSLDKLSNAWENLTTSSSLFANSLQAVIDGLTLLLTFDFDKINSVFTSEDTLQQLQKLGLEAEAAKKPTQELVDSFLELSKGDQDTELIKLVELITKADGQLNDLQNQSGRLRAQNKDKISNLKDTIESLENQYEILQDAQSAQIEANRGVNKELDKTDEVVKRTTHSVSALSDEMQGLVIKMREIRTAAADPETNFDEDAIISSLETTGQIMLSKMNKFLKLRGEQEERLTAKIKAEEELRRELIEEGAFLAIDSVNALFDIRVDKLAQELEVLKAQKQNELQIVGDNEAARVEVEDRFAARERDIRTKQVKAEKAQALFNIAINTATGIAKTLGQFGIPLALPFMAVLTAVGIAQAAAVAAQPIPAFAEGGTSPGGLILVGEEGPELVQTGPGEYHKFSRPTLVDSPRGAQIFDAATTRQMEGNITPLQTLNSLEVNYPESNSLQGLQRIQREIQHSNGQVVNAIKDIPAIKERLGIGGTYTEVTRRNQRKIYLNSKYRLG